MNLEKQMGLILRFFYGYLKGFIIISIVYVVTALGVILLNPGEFSLGMIKYIQTEEYSKLVISWMGHLFMGVLGITEWLKCKNEIKIKKRRKETYE